MHEINKELEVLKPYESNITLRTLELEDDAYEDVLILGFRCSITKNMVSMHNNKYINHVVIPSESRLFDYKENIWNFCDYYVVKPTKSFYNSFSLYL